MDLIEDVYKRCNWNRKRSELEMHRHCGDHHLAICMSTSINLIYKDAVGTSPQRLFDAVRWSLLAEETLVTLGRCLRRVRRWLHAVCWPHLLPLGLEESALHLAERDMPTSPSLPFLVQIQVQQIARRCEQGC